MRAGYDVHQAFNGEDALSIFYAHHFDIVILDIMLPKKNGFEVCQEIRKQSEVIVVMLTALETEDDILRSFKLGADEYVTKPFSPRVLVARVNALVKRLSDKKELSTYHGITIDKEAYKVFNDGVEVLLTPIEYLMIQCFTLNKNIALSRNQILDYAWGETYYGDDRVVDTHIKNLRKKLGDKGQFLKTVKNVGYRFEVN